MTRPNLHQHGPDCDHRIPPTRPPHLVDDGYLVEPEPLDERVPHGWTPEPRRGCSVLPWLAAVIATALLLLAAASLVAAPRSTAVIQPAGPSEGDAVTAAVAPSATPRGTGQRSTGAPQPLPPLGASPVRSVSGKATQPSGAPVQSTPAPTGELGTALIGGWISWADPELGGDYLATRFPRGTLVRLCSERPVCILRITTDFGPSAAIDPPRIADLAVLDWEQLCGLPRARGLCRGTVETVELIPLPATDAVQ